MTCAQVRDSLHPYLDRELAARELLEVEDHLLDCAACRRDYEDLCSVVDCVRGSRPLYEMPKRLHLRVAAFLANCRRRRTIVRACCLSSLACLLAIAGLFWQFQARSAASRSFVSYAAATHRRYVRGLLPLDFVSRHPREMNRWLAKRLDFHFELPSRLETNRSAMVGARLVQYGQSDAPYISFQADGVPVSLLALPSSRVAPGGAASYHSGRLQFYVFHEQGQRVIAWADHNITYALVSEPPVTAAQSCAVCHAAPPRSSK